jgi:uncharacterized membrane protein YdcZ (DUF606 family)
MESLLGTRIGVFLGLNVVVFGFAAMMTGQALAATWRSPWQGVFYCLLLGAANRFMDYALFGGALLSPGGYVVGTSALLIIFGFTYRATQARKMVAQYPWLYERSGLLSWREK